MTRRLQAGLIGLVGDTRITKSGLTLLRARIEGILGPLQRNGSLDGFEVQIPVLDILSRPEASWSPADKALVTEARTNRVVSAHVVAVLGPDAHKFEIVLAPTFA